MRNDIPRAWGGLGLLRRVGDASPSELERSLSFRLRRRVNDLWGITYIYHVSGPHQMGKGKELLFIKEEGRRRRRTRERKSKDCAWHLADALLATTLLQLEARC